MAPRAPRHATPRAGVLVAALLVAGCTTGLQAIENRPGDGAVTTGGPWSSMIYAAWTDEGVILVDLGWDWGGDGLREVLGELEATAEDVVAVFLTHSHRDHIAAWPHVAHARFHMAEAEVPFFLGEEIHKGVVPWVVSVVPSDRPEPGEVEIGASSGDTAFVLGADTIRAFPVPGHTPGSAAYLFRGILFAGDALSYTRMLGFQPAQGIFSDDRELARRELASLLRRVESYTPEHVCTAHAECTEFASLVGDLAVDALGEDEASEAPVPTE